MRENCICDLKEGQEETISEGYWASLEIELKHGEYFIHAIGEGVATLKINFCPLCGRKLDK